ncbi:MAG: inositol phosphorylceramide synthase [Prevotella sp.]|nr:inositol phosphorylceramide synthase [Prevotella sp.]
MPKSRLFDLRDLTRKEILTVLTLSALFLVFQALVVGLLPAHVLMVALFNLLFFAHPFTRKLAVALIPFVLFEISYDWMRLYPNYKVNPIDIRGLYEAELNLFGITSEGTTMIPGEYFSLHHTTLGDVLAGCFYLCWVPLPMAFGLWLFFKGERRMYLHFALAFLFVNLVGFCGYYIHPAAPPWYALNYGFIPDFSTPGNVAGLARFDELVGIPVFNSIYVNNSNIFAAVPSLHAAYMLVATIYAVLSRRSWPMVAVMAVVTAGIWWTAVYSCHHYIIDVLLGIATGFVGVWLFEKGLMRLAPFGRFVDRYVSYIE